jgi:hypothetical protein
MTSLVMVVLILLAMVVYLVVAQAMLGLRSQLSRRQVQSEAWESSQRIKQINRAAQADILRELMERRSRQGPRP